MSDRSDREEEKKKCIFLEDVRGRKKGKRTHSSSLLYYDCITNVSSSSQGSRDNHVSMLI